MTDQLPMPHWAGKNGKGSLSPGGFGVKPVSFEEVEIGSNKIEFTIKDNKMIFHFFKKEGPFPLSFRSRLWNSFRNNMGLHGKENQLAITFEPELDSWCVIIKDVAAIVPPSEETIAATLYDIVGG